MRFSVEQGAPAPSYVPLTDEGTLIREGLASNETVRFDLEFRAPLTTDDIGQTQAVRVTILAIEED